MEWCRDADKLDEKLTFEWLQEQVRALLPESVSPGEATLHSLPFEGDIHQKTAAEDLQLYIVFNGHKDPKMAKISALVPEEVGRTQPINFARLFQPYDPRLNQYQEPPKYDKE
eukprot:2790018-Rhodomonas_salina.1